MTRKKLFIANWKMNLPREGAEKYAAALVKSVAGGVGAAGTAREVVIAPPSSHIQAVSWFVKAAGGGVGVAAQNIHEAVAGAFTGEVSGEMVRSVGAEYVLVGHSERRQYAGETDELVNTKMQAAVRAGLRPVLCVGETLDEREAGQTGAVVERQLQVGLSGLERGAAAGLVIAYEPVWAIGTGQSATPTQAQEVMEMIRARVVEMWGAAAGDGVRILYGGSVTPENIAGFMAEADVDGALVGGASLDSGKFAAIIG